jgi:hypothetical protein
MPGFPFFNGSYIDGGSGEEPDDLSTIPPPLDYQTVLPYRVWSAYPDETPVSKITYLGLQTLPGKSFTIEVAGSWSFTGASGTLGDDGASAGSASGAFDYSFVSKAGQALPEDGGAGTYVPAPNYPKRSSGWLGSVGQIFDIAPSQLYAPVEGGSSLGFDVAYPDVAESTGTYSSTSPGPDFPYAPVTTTTSPTASVPVPDSVFSYGLYFYRPTASRIFAGLAGELDFSVSSGQSFGVNGSATVLFSTGNNYPAIPSSTDSTTITAGPQGTYSGLGFDIWYSSYVSVSVPGPTDCTSSFSLTGVSFSDA